MKILRMLALLIMTAFLPHSVNATVLFQLKNSAAVELVDEAQSFLLAVGGITATLTAGVVGNGGPNLLNTTTSNFGVNAGGTGDVTDMIDSALGIESVNIVFNVPVRLDQLVLSVYSTPTQLGTLDGDQATLKIGAFSSQTLIPFSSATDTYDFSSNNLLGVGQTVVLTYLTGNGFSFDSFSVTAVPEAASISLLALGLAGLGFSRRK